MHTRPALLLPGAPRHVAAFVVRSPDSQSQPAATARRRGEGGTRWRGTLFSRPCTCVLRPEAAAVLARAGPALSLHEQAPPRGAGAPALRRRRRRRLRPALGRDRRRQDDGVPVLPRADPEALQRRLHLQPEAHRDGASEDRLRRVPHPDARPPKGPRRRSRPTSTPSTASFWRPMPSARTTSSSSTRRRCSRPRCSSSCAS
jgi:hypothetical protein